MDLNALLPNNLSQINNDVLSNHSNQQESLVDQPCIDEEINKPTAASDSPKNQWHMPTPINLESSGLRGSSRTEVLARCGLVYSNTTLMDQDEGMTKPQNAHLRSASQRSFSSVRVPFSTIYPFGGLSCWVQSLAVKVQASSTPTVSRHAFALFASEPVTSTKQISLPNTALNATAEMQLSADISQDPGPLAEQPIAVTDSSQYNLRKVSRHAVALSAFEHVTSPNQNSFATIALKAIVEMQASADSNKTCNAFRTLAHEHQRFNITQLIFQLIDVSVTNFQMILIVYSSQLKRELVDFSSTNVFPIANLDSVSVEVQQVSLIQ